jgi:mRNA interferase MazF
MARVTKSMTTYQPGEILLVAFPDSSGSLDKQRPAMVIADVGDEDVVLARITTQLYSSDFDLLLNDWKVEGLLAPSVVRLHKIATLEKRLVKQRLGKVTPSDQFSMKRTFDKLVAL